MAFSIVDTPQATDHAFDSDRLNIALPAGLLAGDLIFAVFNTPNEHVVDFVQTGWTQLGTTQDAGDAGSVDASMSILYRVADGTEGATEDFGNIFAAGESGGVLTFAYRGVSATAPINAVAQNNTISTTASSGAEVTSTENGCLILHIFGGDALTSAESFTADTSPAATKVYDSKVGTGDFSYVGIQSYEQATAGAVTLEAVSNLTRSSAHYTVALAPDGGSLSVTGDLTPNTAFTVNYSGFSGVPTSPLTISDSQGNTITVAVTITDNGDGTGTADGTMPDLPSTGSVAGLLFGTVTLELS